MDRDTGQEPNPELPGQTSINEYLTPTTAIIPVEVREPTDVELSLFLSGGAA
jgi:hypothetical protein